MSRGLKERHTNKIKKLLKKIHDKYVRTVNVRKPDVRNPDIRFAVINFSYKVVKASSQNRILWPDFRQMVHICQCHWGVSEIKTRPGFRLFLYFQPFLWTGKSEGYQ